MENIKKLIFFLFSISHATTQNYIWKQFLSIMIVPCTCCLLLELSFSTVLAHTLWTLTEFTAFFVFPCHTNTTQCTPSASGYRHNYKEADCFQATPTVLTNPRYACATLRYQPFFLNIVSPFSFPYNAGTDILDDLHKHQYSSQFSTACVWNIRYELSGKSLKLKPRNCRKCTLLFRYCAVNYWSIDTKHTAIVAKLCTLRCRNV